MNLSALSLAALLALPLAPAGRSPAGLPGGWHIRLALLLLLLLPAVSACSLTRASVSLGPDGKPIAVAFTSMNFINDRSLNYSHGDGTNTTTLGYNNNPNEPGQAGAFAVIGKALDKIPAVPVVPAP